MKPTVHDIARQAGVSLATVDRVLNDRPGVRGVTRHRVEEAISALGYVRDVAAANLAKGRTYAFVLILPDNDNSFMAALRDEARLASARAVLERTVIEVITVAPFDVDALAAALEKAERLQPDGVAFVAVEAAEIRSAVARMMAAGIAVATLVSDLSQSPHDHFVGIDNVAAGRTAASLMGRFLRAGEGPVAVLAGSMLLKDHRERLDGFRSVLDEDFPDLALLSPIEARDDPVVARRLVGEALSRRPDIAGIYSLGAGNRGLIRALHDHAGRHGGGDAGAAGQAGRRPVVIAHELTRSTRAALTDGLIDAVLNQDAGHEIRSALRVLKSKADGRPVIAAQERIRIDIFLKDNLP